MIEFIGKVSIQNKAKKIGRVTSKKLYKHIGKYVKVKIRKTKPKLKQKG